MLRGDVHSINLPRGRGRVQHGRRFAVVVQADQLMALSTVTVCPTSQSVIPASFRPEVELGGIRTHVLCEMAAAVDIHSVGERVGHLSHSELAAVDDGLRFVLGLP